MQMFVVLAISLALFISNSHGLSCTSGSKQCNENYGDYQADDSEDRNDLDTECSSNDDCKIPFSFCANDKCGCINGFKVENQRCKPESGSKYGEACTSNSKCSTPNTRCNGGYCACIEGYVFSDDDDGCVAQKGQKIGEDCVEQVNCSGRFTVCDKNKKCSCLQGHHQQGLDCVPHYGGEQCSSDMHCLGRFTSCRNGTCACATPDVYKHGYHCVFSSGIPGEHCERHEDCKAFHSACVSNKCVCEQKFHAQGFECVRNAPAAYGLECDDDNNCTSRPYLTCENGRCGCMPGYVQHGYDCVHAQGLGRYCLNDEECSSTPLTSCRNNLCTCLDGFVAVDYHCQELHSVQIRSILPTRYGLPDSYVVQGPDSPCRHDLDCAPPVLTCNKWSYKCQCVDGFISDGHGCIKGYQFGPQRYQFNNYPVPSNGYNRFYTGPLRPTENQRLPPQTMYIHPVNNPAPHLQIHPGDSRWVNTPTYPPNRFYVPPVTNNEPILPPSEHYGPVNPYGGIPANQPQPARIFSLGIAYGADDIPHSRPDHATQVGVPAPYLQPNNAGHYPGSFPVQTSSQPVGAIENGYNLPAAPIFDSHAPAPLYNSPDLTKPSLASLSARYSAVNLGAYCRSDDECQMSHLRCDFGQHRCICNVGYTPDGDSCIKHYNNLPLAPGYTTTIQSRSSLVRVLAGNQCQQNAHCMSQALVCDARTYKCVCASGYKTEGQFCIIEQVYHQSEPVYRPITPGSLPNYPPGQSGTSTVTRYYSRQFRVNHGQHCNSNYDCNHGLVCNTNNYKCVCPPGVEVDGDVCVFKQEYRSPRYVWNLPNNQPQIQVNVQTPQSSYPQLVNPQSSYPQLANPQSPSQQPHFSTPNAHYRAQGRN